MILLHDHEIRFGLSLGFLAIALAASLWLMEPTMHPEKRHAPRLTVTEVAL